MIYRLWRYDVAELMMFCWCKMMYLLCKYYGGTLCVQFIEHKYSYPRQGCRGGALSEFYSRGLCC